jgi:transcriptional regulator with XRE-family HTH domain
MIGQETTFDRIAELGRRFKQYRKAVGLTQHDLHYNTGVALSTISLFENGKGQGLSLAHFYLLMDALDLETSPDILIPEVHRSNLAKLWERQNKRRKQ